MKIGYAKTLTGKLDSVTQETFIDQYAVEKFYVDKISSTSLDAPRLTDMLKSVREGDTVIVNAFSEVAYNVRVFLKIVEQLELKKVTFISIRENLDTSTSTGKFAVFILTELKQLEHENLLERQRIGIEQAKAEGKYKGRKPIEIDETQFERLYSDWQKGKTTPKIMMNELHLKPATFWRKVKDYRNRNKITDAPTMRRWRSDSAETNNKEEL